MLKDVISATYRGEYKIEVTFEDGVTGIVDFFKYQDRGGVFEKFRDMNFFREFHINVELGVLTWGEEVDIAPETLYAEATNSPLPEWMDSYRSHSANKPLQRTA
jgi:hypothetical protein